MKGQEGLKGHASLQFNFRLMGCRCLTPASGCWFSQANHVRLCGWLLTALMLQQVRT